MEYLVLLLSLACIVFGADYLVAGAVAIARKYKVSDFVIGAAIVGVGTSMPEMVVSYIGTLENNPDIAIGNVVGSNIFNILGILGLTAMFFPIAVSRENMRFELPVCIAVSALLTLLVFNFFAGGRPTIGRLDGFVLLLSFGLFMWYSFRRDRKSAKKDNPSSQAETGPIWKALLKTTTGLVILIVSCDLFVESAVSISKSFGVSDAFISLTLIACGTSLPELAASLFAAIKKNTQLALGNIIGSNIFNITWILGLCSQAAPLESSGITIVDYLVMIIAAVLPFLFGFKGRLSRIDGLIFFCTFIAYTWFLLESQA
jgi:cation:H+ antiporter